MVDILGVAIVLCVIVFSMMLHELAHGAVAFALGDTTAKDDGRLTLNPMKHLDPFGTVCMVFLHVGWAKPVPVNPRNFRHFRRDYILVSLAGIVTNLLLCILYFTKVNMKAALDCFLIINILIKIFQKGENNFLYFLKIINYIYVAD